MANRLLSAISKSEIENNLKTNINEPNHFRIFAFAYSNYIVKNEHLKELHDVQKIAEISESIKGETGFNHLYVMLRSCNEKKFLNDSLESVEKLMKISITFNNLRLICHINKYGGNSLIIDNDGYRLIVTNNYIKYALARQQVGNSLTSSQRVIDALFNVKIINLVWTEIGNRKMYSYEQVEFLKQFIKVFDTIKIMLDSKRNDAQLGPSDELLDKTRNALNEDLVRIIHISIFQMFVKNENDNVKELIKNKCHTISKLSYGITTGVLNSNDFMKLSQRLQNTAETAFIFYSQIQKNNLTDVIKYMDIYTDYNDNWNKTDFLPLYIAIQQNASEIVEALLNRGQVDPNLTDYQNSSALHWSMKFPKIFEIIKNWSKYRCNHLRMKQNALLRYPIYYAIKYDNHDGFEYCVKEQNLCKTSDGKLVKEQLDIFNKSLFVLAIKYGRYDMYTYLKEIFKENTWYQYTWKSLQITDQFPLLLIAIDQHQTEFYLEMLSSNPSCFTHKSQLGISPLMMATLSCNTDAMLKLLVLGANINEKILTDIDYVTYRQYSDENLSSFACKWFYRENTLSKDAIAVLKILLQQNLLLDDKYKFPIEFSEKYENIFKEHKTECLNELKEIDESKSASSRFTLHNLVRISKRKDDVKQIDPKIRHQECYVAFDTYQFPKVINEVDRENETKKFDMETGDEPDLHESSNTYLLKDLQRKVENLKIYDDFCKLKMRFIRW